MAYVQLAMLVVSLFALCSERAFAQKDDRPIWQRELMPTQATGRLFDINVRGMHFRVPDAYFSMWRVPMNHGYPEPAKTYDGFGFAFWVSDAKPTALAMSLRPEYWSGEAGRATGGEDDFIVYADLSQPRQPGSLKSMAFVDVLPGAAAYVVNRLSDERLYSKDRDPIYGLTRYTQNGQAFREIVATTPTGEDPEVVLISSWPRGPAPNPTWRTFILSRADGFYIELRFPEVAMRRWTDVVCQTLTLLRTWKVPDGQPPGRGCPKQPRMSLLLK